MNRRKLFKFLGALPLLAITPKKEWKPETVELWYVGPNQRATYRWVATDGSKWNMSLDDNNE